MSATTRSTVRPRCGPLAGARDRSARQPQALDRLGGKRQAHRVGTGPGRC